MESRIRASPMGVGGSLAHPPLLTSLCAPSVCRASFLRSLLANQLTCTRTMTVSARLRVRANSLETLWQHELSFVGIPTTGARPAHTHLSGHTSMQRIHARNGLAPVNTLRCAALPVCTVIPHTTPLAFVEGRTNEPTRKRVCESEGGWVSFGGTRARARTHNLLVVRHTGTRATKLKKARVHHLPRLSTHARVRGRGVAGQGLLREQRQGHAAPWRST